MPSMPSTPSARTKLLEKTCVNATDANNRIYSANGMYCLEVYKNGGLSLWKVKSAFSTEHEGVELWTNNVTGAESPDTRLCLEDDGKLAVYKSADKSQVLWTGSFADIAKFTEYGNFEDTWEPFDAANPDYALVISNDGVLQQTEDEKSIVWKAGKGDPAKGAAQNPKISINVGPVAPANRRVILGDLAPMCMTALGKDGNNRLYSSDGKFALELELDGTLATWKLDDKGNHVGDPIWYSSKIGNTTKSSDHFLCMQPDGNLVVYYDPSPSGSKKVAVWDTNTRGQKIALSVTDNGRAVMRNPQNEIVWFGDGSSPRTPDGISKGSITSQPTNQMTSDNCGPLYGGAKCPNNLCCSASGWCGTSEKHCGAECNKDFGTCSVVGAPAKLNADNCGPWFGGAKCPNNLCCSSSGWCGTGDKYCGQGCNKDFGTCSAVDAPPAGSNGECGPNNGGAKCPNDMCCSSNGFCGTGYAYCGLFCQKGYGNCGIQNDAPLGPRKAIMMQSKKADGEKEWYKPELEQKHVAFFTSIGYEDARYVEYTTRDAFIALMKLHVSVPQDGKFHHRWLSLDAHGVNNTETVGSSTIDMWAGDATSKFTTEDLQKIIFDITPSNCILMCCFFNCQNENLAYGFHNFEAIQKHRARQIKYNMYQITYKAATNNNLPLPTPVEDPGQLVLDKGIPLYENKNIVVFTTANKDQIATNLGGDSLLGIMRDTYDENKNLFMGGWVEKIESGIPANIRSNYSAHVSKPQLYYMKPLRIMQSWSTVPDTLGLQA